MTPKNMKFNLNVIEKLPVVSTSFLGHQSVLYRFSQDTIFNKYLLNFEMSCFSAKLNLIFLIGQRCGLRECMLHLVFNFLAGCLINYKTKFSSASRKTYYWKMKLVFTLIKLKGYFWHIFISLSTRFIYPANKYLFKFNNRNIRKRCERCSKLTIRTPERRHWSRSGVFIVNFEHLSHLFLVFLLVFVGLYELH